MRTTILRRSVVALASIAIGSVALSAVPANAAAPAGVTREQVLAVAANARATNGDLSDAALATLDAIAKAACKVTADETLANVNVTATGAGSSADGFVASAFIFGSSLRSCDFGAIAVTDAGATLHGSSTVTSQTTDTPAPGSETPTSATTPLRDQVTVTQPVAGVFSTSTTLTAKGAATKTVKTKVSTPKTKAQKKAAKKKYAKRLASAKKTYKKALAKAGSSKTKKASAKKAYAKKRASAKKAYKKAIARSKIVSKTSSKPFDLTATANGFTFPTFPPIPLP